MTIITKRGLIQNTRNGRWGIVLVLRVAKVQFRTILAEPEPPELDQQFSSVLVQAFSQLFQFSVWAFSKI